MMKKLAFFLVGLFLSAAGRGQEIVVPNAVQKEWADAEIGVIIHFDMFTLHEDYDFRQWGTHPDASTFNPTELNTDQWLETAQKLGAKYAVLVAKHCSGFSLWPTEAHPYSVKNCPWKDGKGDIVKDFIASCRKYGIRPGIYASTTANGYLWVNNPGLVQPGSPVTQKEYNAIVTQQLTELWSNYGPLFEIWFDGGVLTPREGGADVLSLVRKLQPQAIAFQGPYGHENLIRWVGNEEGTAPDPCWATADETTNSDGVKVIDGLNGRSDAPYWCPGESDFTLRFNSSYQGGWFWHKDQDDQMFSLEQLMHKYETSVGRNTNMLLGIVIDDRGLVPDADVQRITEFGNEIARRYGSPLAQTSGSGNGIVLKLEKLTQVDRVVLQEDIAKGERVLEYTLEGQKADGTWQSLTTGTCIGHKKIDRFAPVSLKALRLNVKRSKATPQIRTFAVFEASPQAEAQETSAYTQFLTQFSDSTAYAVVTVNDRDVLLVSNETFPDEAGRSALAALVFCQDGKGKVVPLGEVRSQSTGTPVAVSDEGILTAGHEYVYIYKVEGDPATLRMTEYVGGKSEEEDSLMFAKYQEAQPVVFKRCAD